MNDHIATIQDMPLAALAERLVLDLALDLVERDDVEATPQTELNDLGFDSVAYHGLAGLINEEYALDLSPTIFFDAHTPRAIALHLVAHHRAAVLARHRDALPEVEVPHGAAALPRPDASRPDMPEARRASAEDPVAIVGMAGVMPKSPDLDAFWRNLAEARDLVDEIPADRWDWRDVSEITPIRWGGFMSDADCFDAPFFAISPTEAQQMDPQQRLFLETAWKAFEDAGIRPSSLAGSDTGVFVGVGTVDYQELSNRLDGHTATGSSHAILANRLSYLLDLHGPSEPVDTACSSSLVALHKAVEAIRTGECGLAVVGGVNAMLTPSLFIALTRAGMLSPEGKCKTFSKHADGYVRGEGVAALVLKPLSQAVADGNPIHAVIRGSAVNHGGRASSLTAPNASAQAGLIVAAWSRAGVDPSTASYMEAHGTGTPLGDPIEVEALERAFQRLYQDWGLEAPAEPHCGLGSVKTNIGHLEAAAGIAGLIKVVLAMRHGILPASLHFDELNPYISFAGSPFHVVGETVPWKKLSGRDGLPAPYRAGVSSFGFGGVNAHVVVESFDRPTLVPAEAREDLFVLSARDDERLRAYAAAMQAWLERKQPSLADLCHTSRAGREAMKCRLAVAASDLGGLRGALARYLEAGAEAGPPVYTSAATTADTGKDGLHALAARWCAGEEVDWASIPHSGGACLIPMPTYPFARLRYWCDGESRLGRRTAALLESAAGNAAELSDEGNSTEVRLAAICSAVLGHEYIGPDQPLGELGADSILAAQIRGRILQTFRVELSLGAMIEAGTVALIAAMIDAQTPMPQVAEESGKGVGPWVLDKAGPISDALLSPRPAGANPLSAAQAQFFFLDRMTPGNPAFNLPGAIRVDGQFDVQAAIAAFHRAVRNHATLRARFHSEAGEPVASLAEEAEAPAEFVDLAHLLPREQAARAEELIRSRVHAPFDLARGALCRLLILELGDEDHVTLLSIHHIASDFTSLAILLREIVSAGQNGPPAAPPVLEYADYAWWESQNLPRIIERELPYWTERLAGLPCSIPLPFDTARPELPTYRGATVRFDLDRAATEAVSAFAQRHKVSPFIVLLAAFKAMLHRLGDCADIAVGSPYANRSMPGTADMVGCLAYALILRTRFETGQSFADLVGEVRQTVYGAFDHLCVPYTRLVEELNPERKPGVNPLFQVMFNVIPTAGMPPEWRAVDVDPSFTDYDLFMRIHLGRSSATGYLQFGLDVFTRETAELIAAYYRDLVSFLVEHPEIRLNEMQLPEALEDRKGRALDRDAPKMLRVASTFTDRLLAEGMTYWSRETGRLLDVSFAGYNQLFQEVFDHSRPFFTNRRGFNLMLVRSQDWLRFDNAEGAEERLAVVRENLEDLADALAAAAPRMAVPGLVVLMPSDPAQTGIADDVEFGLYQDFAARLAGAPGLDTRCWRDIAEVCPVAEIFDPIGDEAGHVPYSREYFAAAATLVARWMDGLGEARAPDGVWNRKAAEIVAAADSLPQPGSPTKRKPFAAPETEEQRLIVEAFEATLKTGDIGIDDGFFDLGGHSLLAIGLLYRLNEVFAVKLSVADIFMASTPRQLAERIATGSKKAEFVDLKEAAILDEDIRPLAERPAGQPLAVLLTGATGFVGRFLLRELLDRTDARIYCLIRAADRAAGEARLRETMERWGLWAEGDEARIVAVPGDLGSPRLKLEDEVYATLCREVDAIYHNATSMNHLETFAMARAANVDGVREMLRMAVCERPKTFNYVSTLGVFSALGREGEHIFDETSPIDAERHLSTSGYTTSKWVGEQLVHLARERGIPCNVFRLGLVTGDAREGRYDELQSFNRLLKSCIRLGAAFEGFRYDLVITPVDYVARAMVHLAGGHAAGGGVFHLSSMTVTPMEEVFRLYNAVAEPALRMLSHRGWLDEVRALFQAGEALPIMPLVHSMMDMDEQALAELARVRSRTTLIYDCTRTQAQLEAAEIRLPPFDAELFRVYLREMQAADGSLKLRLKVPLDQSASAQSVCE